MLIQFDFNDSFIRMEKRADGHIWVCITDMAKASGKLVGHWTQLKSTQEFLTAFEGIIGIKIMEVNVGGSPETTGTWAIQEVAIEFAGWCSLDFKLWVLRQIKRLMNDGQVSLKENETLDSQKVLLNAMDLMAQMSTTLENREKLLQQTIRSLSILEEERLDREYYLGQINEITKEHPLFSSLLQFAMTLKREQYTFPPIGYKVSQILQMFPIKYCSEKRFANLCSDLYWLNKNKKPNEVGTYKYTGEELIYPTLILFKQEGYSWEELKEGFEIDYKCRFPASNRRALLEIIAKKERQLKAN